MLKDIIHLVYPYRFSPLWRMAHPRRFIAYGVGLEKSGTHSIAAMLSPKYRAEHEADVGLLNSHWVEVARGERSKENFEKELKRRDRYSWLEMDASHPHVHYVDMFLKLNPDAKVILTIRDCYSWLSSVINQHVLKPRKDYFDKLHEWRYEELREDYTQEDQFLKDEYQMPSCKAYLTYWSSHIERALEVIPESSLLVLRTHELSNSSAKIADFLGIPESDINNEKSHAYKAEKRIPIISRMSRDYLETLAQQCCGKYMDQFFNDQDYYARVADK